MQLNQNQGTEELWKSYTNVLKTHSEESITKIYERLEDTPFYIAGNVEQGMWLTFGKYRLSEVKELVTEYNSRQNIWKQYAEDNKWTLITDLIDCIIKMNTQTDFNEIK